jgi:hypothetical protein
MNRREYITNTGLLLGYSLTFGTVATVMHSCKNEGLPSSSRTTNFKRKSFDQEQKDLMAQLTETIIPKTDTPGAIETKIPQFAEKMVLEVFDEKDYNAFMKGLNEINAECKASKGKTFLACTKEEKEAYLNQLDKDLPKFPPTMWGIVLIDKPEPLPFFRRLKALTLMGYFTSKELEEFNKGKATHG